MRELYIGDFYNPDAEKESWEDYVTRKKKEEEGQMSTFQRLILIGIFVVAFTFLYNYIVNVPDADKWFVWFC